jgi:hypothetical protein
MIKSVPRRAVAVLCSTLAIILFFASVTILTAPAESDGLMSRPFSRPAGGAAAPPPSEAEKTAPPPAEEPAPPPPAPSPTAARPVQVSEPSASKPAKAKEGKYFHEAGGGMGLIHYDARYFVEAVPYDEHIVVLRNLVRSYLAMMRSVGLDTWIAHGTLLGWWWNERIMPWDYDADVQVNDTVLLEMGDKYNMTQYQFDIDTFRIGELISGVLDEDEQARQDKEVAEAQASAAAAASSSSPPASDYHNGNELDRKTPEDLKLLAALGSRSRTYLLDVNPNSRQRSRMAGRNVIDARWIDVENGMFIDITGLSELDPRGRPGVVSCKNNHHYPRERLFPLRRGEFEGVAAWLPNDVEWVLADEYGAKSMVETQWQGHTWNAKLREWIKDGWFQR